MVPVGDVQGRKAGCTVALWFGGALMALGGLFCLFDPRYRSRKKAGIEERT